MTHEDYKKAAEYWKNKDQDSNKMDHEKLLQSITEYIRANDTCALATGSGTFIRCTPIEYTYHDDAFWIFTEGGEKFIGLENNKNVCISVFDKYAGFGKLRGMQISGTAAIIEPFSNEYNAAAEFKKIPLSALKKLPSPMHLLKIKPKKIEFLNSSFKVNGYSSRQSLEFN